MEILWTRFAKITYFEVLENLNNRWTSKEIKEFIDLTTSVLTKIKLEEVEFPSINDELNIRKAIIHKNVSLFFKSDTHNQKTYLISFFNNRMNPKTLQKLLNNH